MRDKTELMKLEDIGAGFSCERKDFIELALHMEPRFYKSWVPFRRDAETRFTICSADFLFMCHTDTK